MKRNHLMASLALGLVAATGVAQASNGWYIEPRVGGVFFDSGRNLDDTLHAALGLGWYLTPNTALDLEFTHSDAEYDNFSNMEMEMYGFGLGLRHEFGEGNFRPHIGYGLGWLRDKYPSYMANGKQNEAFAKVGVGASWWLSDNTAITGDVAYRYSFQGNGVESQPAADGRPVAIIDDKFGDFVATVGLRYVFGRSQPAPVEPPPPPPPPPPAEPHCSELDSDGDGVNDCDDRCPNTPAGTVVGPDGCEIQVAVDLRGVEFDFDRSTLRPESRQTLDEATEVLRQYPDIRVEVAGHTDSIGTEEYNQGLSERRAAAVYEYLVNNGIDASRLSSRGYGELQPIADNTSREGRQRNRRVELVVE